jgi:hypothetical protein
MTDAAFLELLASYEAALETGTRNVTLARALAHLHLFETLPPQDVISEYLAQVDRDEARLNQLREKVKQFRKRINK